MYHEEYLQQHYNEFAALRDQLILLNGSRPPGEVLSSTVYRTVYKSGMFAVKQSENAAGRFQNIQEYKIFEYMVKRNSAEIYEKLLPAYFVSDNGNYLVVPAFTQRSLYSTGTLDFPRAFPNAYFPNIVYWGNKRQALLHYPNYAPMEGTQVIKPVEGSEKIANLKRNIREYVLSDTASTTVDPLYVCKMDIPNKEDTPAPKVSDVGLLSLSMLEDAVTRDKQIPWHMLPGWIKHIVQNQDGWYIGFEYTPYRGETWPVWQCRMNGRYMPLFRGFVRPDNGTNVFKRTHPGE